MFPLTSSKKSKLFKGYQENDRFSKYILLIAYLSYYLMFQIRKLTVTFSFMICFWAYRNSWTLNARVGRWALDVQSPASRDQLPTLASRVQEFRYAMFLVHIWNISDIAGNKKYLNLKFPCVVNFRFDWVYAKLLSNTYLKIDINKPRQGLKTVTVAQYLDK